MYDAVLVEMNDLSGWKDTEKRGHKKEVQERQKTGALLLFKLGYARNAGQLEGGGNKATVM